MINETFAAVEARAVFCSLYRMRTCRYYVILVQ